MESTVLPPPPVPPRGSLREFGICVWRESPCDEIATAARNLCRPHYSRAYQRFLLDLYPPREKPLAPAGRWLNSDGYVVAREEPGGPLYIEHRAVMEAMLGRSLRKGENVHHKNGVRWDNRQENLEIWQVAQPYGQRPRERVHCPGCRCGDLP